MKKFWAVRPRYTAELNIIPNKLSIYYGKCIFDI